MMLAMKSVGVRATSWSHILALISCVCAAIKNDLMAGSGGSVDASSSRASVMVVSVVPFWACVAMAAR
jgi:hypothetical protein